MNQVLLANIGTFLGTLLMMGGVTGVTSSDISGFFNVVIGILTLGAIVWAHVAHKNVVAQATK